MNNQPKLFSSQASTSLVPLVMPAESTVPQTRNATAIAAETPKVTRSSGK